MTELEKVTKASLKTSPVVSLLWIRIVHKNFDARIKYLGRRLTAAWMVHKFSLPCDYFCMGSLLQSFSAFSLLKRKKKRTVEGVPYSKHEHEREADLIPIASI